MSAKDWKGREPIEDALVDVCASKPPTTKSIKHCTKVMYKYMKDYKLLVHVVLGFLKDTEEEGRLSVLYACDAFIRQVQRVTGAKAEALRDKVLGRFESKLSELFKYFRGVSAADKRGLSKVWGIWKAQSVFRHKALQEAAKAASINPDEAQNAAASAPPRNAQNLPEKNSNKSSAGVDSVLEALSTTRGAQPSAPSMLPNRPGFPGHGFPPRGLPRGHGHWQQQGPPPPRGLHAPPPLHSHPYPHSRPPRQDQYHQGGGATPASDAAAGTSLRCSLLSATSAWDTQHATAQPAEWRAAANIEFSSGLKRSATV